MDKTVDVSDGRPSTWFHGHEYIITPGMRVLDLACGTGRHAVAAGLRGADVVGIDNDEKKLQAARKRASRNNVNITFVPADLETMDIPAGFDVVLLFNYLDRQRFPVFVDAVTPGGWFFGETYLRSHVRFGWGPNSPDHLLEPGELFKLIGPLGLVFGREVTEVIDTRSAARASVVARREQ